MTTVRANDLRRLNKLLKLPAVDITKLNESRWNKLLDELFFAVFGETKRVFRQDDFHFAANTAAIHRAQVTLQRHLPILRRARGTDPAPEFRLSAQRVHLAAKPNGFIPAYRCDDLPTTLYSVLIDLLRGAKVVPKEILACANRCGAFVIPLRKPHAGQKSYCELCGKRVASRNYRTRNKKKLRPSERERNRRRYENRIRIHIPNAKIVHRA